MSPYVPPSVSNDSCGHRGPPPPGHQPQTDHSPSLAGGAREQTGNPTDTARPDETSTPRVATTPAELEVLRQLLILHNHHHGARYGTVGPATGTAQHQHNEQATGPSMYRRIARYLYVSFWEDAEWIPRNAGPYQHLFWTFYWAFTGLFVSWILLASLWALVRGIIGWLGRFLHPFGLWLNEVIWLLGQKVLGWLGHE